MSWGKDGPVVPDDDPAIREIEAAMDCLVHAGVHITRAQLAMGEDLGGNGRLKSIWLQRASAVEALRGVRLEYQYGPRRDAQMEMAV